MGKIQVLMRRAASGSVKRMMRNAKIVSGETGISTARIFADMVWCIAHYGVGYLDYMTFGFAGKSREKRETYMTMYHNLALTRMMNDRDYYCVLDDKLKFNEVYRDFIGRDYLDMREADEQALRSFCAGKTQVFAKATETFGGQGMEKITLTPYTDISQLYSHLKENRMWSLEEVIEQHPEMNRLNPTSVNTIRICTVVTESGPRFVYALVRMGKDGMHVDNISSGGMYTLVGEDGTLDHPAFCDKTAQYYDVHPTTGTVFKGFKIPMFREAVDMCLKAAEVEPHMKYIGWDAAITPGGPVLVEGNNLPGYDMPQNARFHDDGCGLLPRFEELLGFKIPTK